MAKWEPKLWEVSAGFQHRGFVVAKTELSAVKLGVELLKCPWLKVTAIEVEIPGYSLVERGEKAHDGACTAENG